MSSFRKKVPQKLTLQSNSKTFTQAIIRLIPLGVLFWLLQKSPYRCLHFSEGGTQETTAKKQALSMQDVCHMKLV